MKRMQNMCTIMRLTSDDPICPVKYKGLSFNLHVVWSEGYTGGMLRGVEAVFFIFLLWGSYNSGHEDLSIS